MAKPLSVQTKESFATIPVALSPNLIDLATTTITTPANLGNFSINLTNLNNKVLVQGVIPVDITNDTTVTPGSRVDVVLNVYRNTTDTTPFYTLTRTFVVGSAVAATAHYGFTFLFVDSPAIPLTQDTANYFLKAYIATAVPAGVTAITIPVSTLPNVIAQEIS